MERNAEFLDEVFPGYERPEDKAGRARSTPANLGIVSH